jgi:hypothetical protein
MRTSPSKNQHDDRSRASRRAITWAFGVCGSLVVGATATGCVVYDPSLVGADEDAGPIGMDADLDAGPQMTGSRQPPTRPSGPDDGVDDGEVIWGLRRVVLSQGDEWANIGFDIDNRYTQRPDYDTECTPPAAGVRPALDGNEGIDNVFGKDLYPLVELTVPGLETTARMAQEEGFGLPVIRVTGWNGTPNDTRIQVVITTSVFATSAEGAAPDMPPIVDIRGPRDVRIGGEAAPLPAWDGEDWSWVRDDSYVGGDLSRPIIIDDNAYVRDGTFVTRLPSGIDILFPAMDVGVLVRLTDAIAVGVLGENGDLETVTVAGRWSITDLLSTAENVGICRGTTEYNILEGQLGRIADLRRQPPEPGDPILDCDALSLGVTFYGSRLRVAGLTPGAPVLNQCLNDAGVLFQDAGTAADAFVMDDAFATPPDAGRDAFIPAPDAFVPDAFLAPDAFGPDIND